MATQRTRDLIDFEKHLYFKSGSARQGSVVKYDQVDPGRERHLPNRGRFTCPEGCDIEITVGPRSPPPLRSDDESERRASFQQHAGDLVGVLVHISSMPMNRSDCAPSAKWSSRGWIVTIDWDALPTRAVARQRHHHIRHA